MMFEPQQEDLHRLIAETIPQMVWVKRPDGFVEFYNSWGATYHGLPVAQLLGWGWLDAVQPEQQAAARAAWGIAAPNETIREATCRLRRADGVYRWHLLRGVPLRDAQGATERWIGTSTDIEEQKQAERQAVETLAMLDALQSAAPIGFGFIDCEFCFVRCNDTLAMIDGIPAAAHIGRTVQEVVPTLLSQIEPAYRYVIEHNKPVVNIEISGTTAGTPDAERHWLASYYPVEVQGTTIGIGIVVVEVSELKRLEAQFLQSQKMEAIGRLAGGVAHDFNNLLTVINGYAALLLEDSDVAETRQEAITAIHYAGERASLLTRQLLAFSRHQVLDPTLLDLSAVVLQMEGLLKRLLSEDIKLTTLAQPLTSPVYADPGQIEQVVLNLVINARDAMPHGGRLLLETRQLTLPLPLNGTKEPVPPGSYVALFVRDSGEGMDDRTLSHLFEPFFTTKPAGKGTGLGLATVYDIVKQSQGFVHVESIPGIGSAFSVYLPAIAAAAEADDTESDAPLVPGTGELVLLLEDDAAVRRFVRHVLQRHGYNVVEAQSVADALRLVSNDELPIRLVLTDVVLPESSGRMLGDQLAQRRPDLPVIFMSGYTDEEISQRGVDTAAPHFLSKPFSPATLAQKVRGVLDEHSTP